MAIHGTSEGLAEDTINEYLCAAKCLQFTKPGLDEETMSEDGKKETED
jgi:hypothetical protein